MHISQSIAIPQTLREDMELAQRRLTDALITYHIDGSPSSFGMVVLWQNTLNDLCREAAAEWVE